MKHIPNFVTIWQANDNSKAVGMDGVGDKKLEDAQDDVNPNSVSASL